MRIVVSGTVGIGKSTTSKLLVKKLKGEGRDVNFLDEETVDSVYLDYYYQSPADWAFIAQLDFLFGRFKQWLIDEKRRKDHPNQITIYDRHFLDDYVFAELHSIKENISMYNSLTYQAIYKELIEKMHKWNAQPDLFILLKAPLETVMKRFFDRSRDEETDVDADYWRDLHNNYYERPMFKNHFQQNSRKVVTIDTDNKTPNQIVDEIIKVIKENETNN